MTYKIDKKNLNGNYTLSNLILFVGFVFLVVIGLSIIPQNPILFPYTRCVCSSPLLSDGDNPLFCVRRYLDTAQNE